MPFVDLLGGSAISNRSVSFPNAPIRLHTAGSSPHAHAEVSSILFADTMVPNSFWGIVFYISNIILLLGLTTKKISGSVHRALGCHKRRCMLRRQVTASCYWKLVLFIQGGLGRDS